MARLGLCFAMVLGTTAAVGSVAVPVAGAAPIFTPYPFPPGSGGSSVVTIGSDGNLWFTDNNANRITKSTTVGVMTAYPIPTANSQPHGIAAGADGNLWFTERDGNKIGRITTAGVFTEFPIPTAGAFAHGIAAGPDGNLWFVENATNKVGKITTAGVITEYTIPTAGTQPFSIAAGSDGNLWFTENGGGSVGRITPAGVITEFPMPGADTTLIVHAGPDGNLWASTGAGTVARITTAGVVTEFPLDTPNSGPNFITTGPDGNLWVSQILNGYRVSSITTAGDVTEYPFSGGLPGSLTTAPDGNIWVASDASLVRMRVTPTPTGEFTSLTPARILDTRTSLGGHLGKVGAGQSVDVQVTGQGGVPASGVSAAVLNVTVTEPTDFSYLTVSPAGQTKPVVSNLNFEPGQTVPNLVTVKVGANGKVGVYNHFGATHVVIDVAGFYADETGPIGSRFHGVTPSRILDTRELGADRPERHEKAQGHRRRRRAQQHGCEWRRDERHRHRADGERVPHRVARRRDASRRFEPQLHPGSHGPEPGDRESAGERHRRLLQLRGVEPRRGRCGRLLRRRQVDRGRPLRAR